MDDLLTPVTSEVDADLLKDAKINEVAPSSDVVIATDVKNEPKEQEKVSVKDTLTPEGMLASKLVLMQDGAAKVTKLKDIHDAIVAKESINRLEAQSVSLSCEDFLSSRMNLNEFSITDSKINYGYTSNFLKSKIAAEEAAIKALKHEVATESVMEYATAIIKASENKVTAAPLHEKLNKTDKGIYLSVDSSMVNIAKLDLNAIKDVISNASEELKSAVAELVTDPSHNRVLSYMDKRVGGMNMRDSLGIAASASEVTCSLDTCFTYLKAHYVEDIKSISSEYEYYKEKTEANLKELEGKEVLEFVTSVKGIMHDFKITEMLEELTIKLPLLVKVINKVIDATKY